MRRIVPRLLVAILLLASLGVAPVAAGGGCHGADGTVHTEGDSTVVRMDTCSFAPTVVHVPVGTSVRFLNTAVVNHLVVGESRTWGTETELVPGQEVQHTFGTKGVFPYSCPLHPGMVGAVVVGGGDAAAAPPAALAPGAGGGGDPAPVAETTTSSAPAAQAGPSPAALALAGALLALLVVGGVLVWRRQSSRAVASPEA